MTCDFTKLTSLKNDAAAKQSDAKAACDSLDTAESALADAEATLQEATSAKDVAYTAWETAEQKVVDEQMVLGIQPCAAPSQPAMARRT